MIEGVVVHGDGVAAEYGFPTANLDVDPKHIPHKHGIYAAIVWHGDTQYHAAAVIKASGMELHLIGYSGALLYGECLRTEIVKRVSDIIKADTRETLIQKIADDIEKVKQTFA